LCPTSSRSSPGTWVKSTTNPELVSGSFSMGFLWILPYR
jgi:hypothetical protein